MKTTATVPGNKKKVSVPKANEANAKATSTTVNKEKKKKKYTTAANIDVSTDTISTAAAAAGTDDYESMPHVPRKTDRRIIDNDNDRLGIMNRSNNKDNKNNKNNNSNNRNNNNNNNDNNISTAAAAAGTDEYNSMYHVQKDNDKQGIMNSNNNMRDVLEGGAGKKKKNDDDDDDDDDDSDFNDDDDFMGSLGLDFNSSLYADKEGDIVNDSYYCDAGGKGRGRPRNKGCPHKEPDTTGMSDSKRAEVTEEYITLRKAWNDKMLNARRARTPIDVENCTGVTVKSLRRMVDVEERRMKVGDTFPDKETVSLRIVEEINISDSSDATINRSDNHRD